MSDDIAIHDAIETIDETKDSFKAMDLQNDPKNAVGMMSIPYASYLSFGPLIEQLKQEMVDKGLEGWGIFNSMMELLKSVPELKDKIEDESLLEEHRQLVDLLISTVVPPVTQLNQLTKLSKPFEMVPFYKSPGVEDMFNNYDVDYQINRSTELLACATTISSGSLILNRFYGQNLNVTPPILLTAEDTEKGTYRYFKPQMDTAFVEVIPTKPLKPLSQEEINFLISNIYDPEAWLKAMPADAFEFRGFVVNNLIEITEEESVSRLKQSLLKRDAIINEENIRELEKLVRNYLGVPGLRLGITAADYPRERAINHKYKIRFNLIANELEKHLLHEDYNQSIYERTCRYKEVMLIEDLAKLDHPTVVEQKLIASGIRSIIIAPLLNKEQDVIGLLEIGSPKPFALHSFVELKFKDITNLFSIAIERSRNEIDNQIEALIREQFTDIHPSLEWRFIQASYNLLDKRDHGDRHAVMEPIVFHDVYPLYGQADIVGSSRKRNFAIKEDLLDNLNRVRKVLVGLGENIPFPLLNKYIMEVDLAVNDLNEEFNSNDESRIVEMLHLKIHPALKMIQKRNPQYSIPIENYFLSLDEELQIIYNKRKDYEDTVTMINNAIGDYLDQQDKISQTVMPHYFTKYKTDGVEYDQYFGKALLKNDQFCEMHLHNFRLQQLIDMVNVTKLVDNMQDTLPVPLKTAQLVFAYTNTLSIRFREDEKQFDVDGAYNVRYEILKKRIDKAVIDGTSERLTQAGKVAIVYLQDKDGAEYLEYINFLKHEGLITDDIEQVTLGKLQGAQGLKALRFTVKCDDAE
ncbi:MAG: hypothetical protein AAF242_02085 [Bacteroidota bacterium]